MLEVRGFRVWGVGVSFISPGSGIKVYIGVFRWALSARKTFIEIFLGPNPQVGLYPGA